MREKIKLLVKYVDEISNKKPIKIISHYDTDGITAAAIMARALQRWNKKFSLQIVKGLEESIINQLPEDHILLFLDLASGSLNQLKNKKTEIIILDHHEIVQEIPPNIKMINPLIDDHEILSAAGISYLFAKTLSSMNRDLAILAVIGMTGDVLDREINKSYDEIIKDAQAIVKRSLLLYPSTRPLDKTLEYSANPYIPGVTGSSKGTWDLLKEAKIGNEKGNYKSLYELTEEEMTNLITAIILRGFDSEKIKEYIGNLYLIKFFNRIEDARECSALINACSRMGYPSIALCFCLGNKKAKEEAERIHIEHKQHIISALRYVSQTEKISGRNYTIINAKNNIKDTIIGTVASIISRSPIYSEGTIIIALAYNEDKIKVSARLAGKEGLNVREILDKALVTIGGEVGGHPKAAGCLISKDKEGSFIEELKRVLEIETIKV